MAMPITSNTVYNILRYYFGSLISDEYFNYIITIADTSYLPVNGDWLRDMVIHDPILAPDRYRRDIFDCDDYVLYVKTKVSLFAANSPTITRPFAVGYILTDVHAFNFGIDDVNSIFILNTQSAERSVIKPQFAEDCAKILELSANNPIKHIYI
jgi:hypothetical protein